MIGVDADRPYPADRIVFMEEARPYDPPIHLGHHSPGRGRADEGLHQAQGELDRREIARKPMVVIDPTKGLEADRGTLPDVVRPYLSQGHSLCHGGRGRPTHDASFCRSVYSTRVYGCYRPAASHAPAKPTSSSLAALREPADLCADQVSA